MWVTRPPCRALVHMTPLPPTRPSDTLRNRKAGLRLRPPSEVTTMLRAWIPSFIVFCLGVVPLLGWGCSGPGGGNTEISGGNGGTSATGSGGTGIRPGAGGAAGTGIIIPTDDGGMVDNPCDQPDAPPDCMLES